MTSILPLLIPLLALLGVYEAARGIVACRSGAPPGRVIRDFFAAAILFMVVILLYRLDAAVQAIAPVRN